jgi:hypothetical protein
MQTFLFKQFLYPLIESLLQLLGISFLHHDTFHPFIHSYKSSGPDYMSLASGQGPSQVLAGWPHLPYVGGREGGRPETPATKPY